MALDQPLKNAPSIVNARLTSQLFFQLSGNLAGYPFVKVVVQVSTGDIHFIHHGSFAFHSDYIATTFLNKTPAELDAEIDSFNQSVYLSPDREFMLGLIALHNEGEKRFFTLETVEIDNMNAEMIQSFYRKVRDWLDPSLSLLFKPANHLQEDLLAHLSPAQIPRIYSHQMFKNVRYFCLNPGKAKGRIRAFRTLKEYKSALATLEWFDIVVMHRVPDDIPRISGMINAHHTTPLSHTNVLASGWRIPNAIQLGIFEQIDAEQLNGQWVSYEVSAKVNQVVLNRLPQGDIKPERPSWILQTVKIEDPEVVNIPIVSLHELRQSDRYKYGTKAANLGEMISVLTEGSDRALGFYRIARPPRDHLLPYVESFLGVDRNLSALSAKESSDLIRPKLLEFFKREVRVPRGIAIPFSIQQEFLESSPRIQQAIGKLKMALELNVPEVDALSVSLQQLIRSARIPQSIRKKIDTQVATYLSGVSTFVVRSSSNAEDLENFSAAGIYQSFNQVKTAEGIFDGIKAVWASLLSPRSVRLRQQVGISLDACYMGVIVQEEVSAQMGGVLVTTNPTNRADFRNVYINVSSHSAVEIVSGEESPFEYLFNTVEGGGQTLSIGNHTSDLNLEQKEQLQKLAFVGRFMQSHFSPDYLFESPIDMEWLVNGASQGPGLVLLQIRPYAK